MNKGKFVFYESVYKQMERLEKMLGIEKAYAFTKAVMDYGLYGVVPEDDNELWLYGLEQIFTSIDAAQQRYEKNIEDGGKGGRPQKEIDMDLVASLLENGMTKREVATQFGISEDTLSRRLKESAKPQNPQNLNNNINNNNNNNNINNNSNSYQSTNVDCEANASTINALGIDLSKTSVNEVFGEYSF